MANSTTTHLGLAGLTCGSCTSSTTKVLTALPGVVSVDVELTAAVVIHDTALVSPQRPLIAKEKEKEEDLLGPLRRPKVPGYSRGRFMYAVKLLITILTVAYLYSYAQADVSHRPAGWAHAGN